MSLVVGSIVLGAGALAMIGWIGFQEHFRLLTRSFEKEQAVEAGSARAADVERKSQDHSVIETRAEAQAFLSDLRGGLTGLESDDLPEE